MGKILAIDYGEKRVGLALSDYEQKIAFPGKVLAINSENKFFQELKNVLETEIIEKIILGVPKNRDGSLSPAGQKIAKLAETIREKFKCPVLLIDETFTSKEAENLLIELDIPRRKRKKITDKIAATLILRSYLEKTKNEI